jgi:phage terminase large subunit-like protein
VLQEILRDPELTVCIFSHTKPNAKAFLAQLARELETNSRLKSLFPDILYGDPVRDSPSWSLDAGLVLKRSTNPKEATVEAHGLVDGQPTSKHFRLRVYDDVVVKESVATPEQITKCQEAFELSDNLGVDTGGRVWIIGTRYHYADLYGVILERGIAIPRIYPATHDGTLTGNPVLFSKSEFNRRVKAQGTYIVSCQLLCSPISGKERVFEVEDLGEYEVRPRTLNVYLMVDPARSKKKDSANTAMVVIGIDSAGNKYLLDGLNHRMDLRERWCGMRDLWRKWFGAEGAQIVRVGYEKYGAQSDLDYFKLEQEREGLSFEIAELGWSGDGANSKQDRIQRLTPDISGGNFFVPFPTDVNNLTKDQRRLMDNGEKHRIARKILRRNEQGNVYDLSAQFKLQLSLFPLGSLVDLIDAASRLYDLDPRPATVIDTSEFEPEWT